GCLLSWARLGPLEAGDLLPLAVPIAVCEAAEAVAPVRCQVKWPNDVWIDGRKVAGVLIEARPDDGWAVIGVGINVSVGEDEFPAEQRETATSLAPAAAPGHATAPTVRAALEALNGALSAWVGASDEEVLGAYRARDALTGKRISWEGGGGIVKGIDQRGHLLVDTAGGEESSLGAGEVHLAVEG